MTTELINKSEYEKNKLVDSDHVATPRWVVEEIYDRIHIEEYPICWFPFNHYDSEFKLCADELNLKYKNTHKFDDLGNDFFTTAPPKNCALMISNPPFSQQYEIIARSFELVKTGAIKAFVLLLPLSTLETVKRATLYEQHKDKLSIIIFKDRVEFLNRDNGFMYPLCWICYNIKALENDRISWMTTPEWVKEEIKQKRKEKRGKL